jgi:hypothetical protein
VRCKLNDAPIHRRDAGENALEVRARPPSGPPIWGKLGAIVVDYLQLMEAVSDGRTAPRKYPKSRAR